MKWSKFYCFSFGRFFHFVMTEIIGQLWLICVIYWDLSDHLCHFFWRSTGGLAVMQALKYKIRTSARKLSFAYPMWRLHRFNDSIKTPFCHTWCLDWKDKRSWVLKMRIYWQFVKKLLVFNRFITESGQAKNTLKIWKNSSKKLNCKWPLS